MEDFYSAPDLGMELRGSLTSPKRLFFNVSVWAFVVLVPLLYARIFWFRKTHDARIGGGTVRRFRNCVFCLILGISETERKRRIESNSISTKINFFAWLLEVKSI